MRWATINGVFFQCLKDRSRRPYRQPQANRCRTRATHPRFKRQNQSGPSAPFAHRQHAALDDLEGAQAPRQITWGLHPTAHHPALRVGRARCPDPHRHRKARPMRPARGTSACSARRWPTPPRWATATSEPWRSPSRPWPQPCSTVVTVHDERPAWGHRTPPGAIVTVQGMTPRVRVTSADEGTPSDGRAGSGQLTAQRTAPHCHHRIFGSGKSLSDASARARANTKMTSFTTIPVVFSSART